MKRIDLRYQKLLHDLKLYSGRLDGLYGPQTQHAVRKFQQMNGLQADGIIGRRTAGVFETHLAKHPGSAVHNPKIERRNTGFPWPRERSDSLMRFYGKPGHHQTRIKCPYPMKLAWDTNTVITKITCHEKVAASLSRILSDVATSYSIDEINKHGFNMFGGSLNVRRIRGGSRWSTHAWGIAIDIDPARNGLRTSWANSYLSRPECAEFINAFKRQGWYSLGAERNYDSMHFQAAYR